MGDHSKCSFEEWGGQVHPPAGQGYTQVLQGPWGLQWGEAIYPTRCGSVGKSSWTNIKCIIQIMHLYRVIGILTRMQTHGWLLQSFLILISQKPGILRAQPLSSWFGCWGSRSRRGCPQLFQLGRRLSWRTASKGATSPEISKLWQIINTDHFR